MRDIVYLNPITNLNQWYTPHEDNNERKLIVRLITVILTKVKVKAKNHIALPDIPSNNLICDAIRLRNVYVCD